MDALFEMDRPAPTECPDFKSWAAAVRPAFEAAALSGEVFKFYDVAKAKNLPEPPDPAHHWGLLAMHLHGEGLIEQVGFARSTRPGSGKSSLMQWRGVPTGIRGAA